MLQKNTKITYPCPWTITVIGPDAQQLRTAIHAAIPPDRCVITDSNRSRTGAYVSVKVDLTVASENERNRFYQALGTSDGVKFVL